MPRKKQTKEVSQETEVPVEGGGDKVMQDLLTKIEALEKRDLEKDAKIQMLTQVADKGRVFNYENKVSTKKPLKAHLSVYNGKTIVGWRTIKDQLVKHPTTGSIVGEEQEYELLVIDKDNVTSKVLVRGYPAFSDARYTERIEVVIKGKKEDYNGNITYDVVLPDGRDLSLDARFIN
jgi:hypothetical protein